MIELVQLDRDHPGFRDLHYRERRNQIAQLARDHQPGEAAPQISYTAEEQEVWRTALDHLAPLHERYACAVYLESRPRTPFGPEAIPQLSQVNRWLQPLTGLQMSPVAGLVSPRTFMSFLGRRIFLSTQYMRHHSAPLYTPEPDVIHELVGHAPLLADPALAEVNRLFGEVTDAADEAVVQRLIRVYWYTLEFGLVREGRQLKAVGAGLLSSYGELGRFEREAQIHPLNLDAIAQTDFDPTNYQNRLFVADSLSHLVEELTGWLRAQPRAVNPQGGAR